MMSSASVSQWNSLHVTGQSASTGDALTQYRRLILFVSKTNEAASTQDKQRWKSKCSLQNSTDFTTSNNHLHIKDIKRNPLYDQPLYVIQVYITEWKQVIRSDEMLKMSGSVSRPEHWLLLHHLQHSAVPRQGKCEVMLLTVGALVCTTLVTYLEEKKRDEMVRYRNTWRITSLPGTLCFISFKNSTVRVKSHNSSCKVIINHF